MKINITSSKCIICGKDAKCIDRKYIGERATETMNEYCDICYCEECFKDIDNE
jgi:hypothetical protein